jgi:hypothetical protein
MIPGPDEIPGFGLSPNGCPAQDLRRTIMWDEGELN